MSGELRILILEDTPEDQELVVYELRKSGLICATEIVDTHEGFERALDEFKPDLVLADYDLPTFDGLKALEIVKERAPDLPFILVTGRVGEEFAIETLKKGATDYVMKGNLKRLVPSVRRALEEVQLIEDRTQAYQARERSFQETYLLLKSTKAILQSGNFMSTARQIFDMACEITGAQSGYVATLSADGEENEVLFLESGGLPCSVHPYLPMPIRGLRGEAYETGRTVYENDFMNTSWVGFMPDGHVELRNVLFAPLNIEGKTVGIMGLANKPSDFTEDDCRMAEAFGQHAAIALKNSRNLNELLQSKELLRATGEMAKVGGWEIDAETLEVRWTEQTYKIHEVPLDYKPPLEEAINFFHPDDRDKLKIAIQRALQYGEPYDMEIRFITAKGRHLWAHTICIPKVVTGKTVKLIGTFQDITERKQAEEQVKRLNESMGLAMEVSKAGTWDWDIANNTFIWSQEFLKLFGLPSDTVAGFEAWRNCLHPDDRDIAAKRIQDSINDKTKLKSDYRIIMPDQEIRWIRAIGRTFYEKDTPVRMTGICIDITELKKLEEQLRNKIDSLESWNKKFIGREQRMIEMKKEVNSLLEQLGQPKKYIW